MIGGAPPHASAPHSSDPSAASSLPEGARPPRTIPRLSDGGPHGTLGPSDPRPPSRSHVLRLSRPRSLVALLFAVVAVVAGLSARAAAPVAAADGPAEPKVVIIVGATHGATDSYRTRANAAYDEAIKHTPNVVKVYSPNATWSKVKAATAGASIVIYFGHGNGWPSPYTYDPNYTTKDGFGLNATAGNGDNNTKIGRAHV